MKPRSARFPALAAFLLLFGFHRAAVPVEVQRELLVKWKDGPASATAAAGNARIGSSVRRSFDALGWQQVALPPGMSFGDGIDAYRKVDGVESVEPNGTTPPMRKVVFTDVPTPRASLASPAATPNDPRFNSQWYLKKIAAPAAWGVTTGGTNVVVVVIDSGVDYTHPDLAPNMWRNPGETGLDVQGRDKATNGIDDDGDGYVDDVFGIDVVTGTGDPMDRGLTNGGGAIEYHGTGIAGIIGAVGNNGQGIAGVNWSAQVMAIRWDGNIDLNDPSFSHARYWSVNLAAWDYVLMMKRRGVNIRVTSNSYGQRGVESLAVRDAIEMAGREGILSIFSGGYAANEDLTATFPASFNLASVINVSGTSVSDTLADWGNGVTGDVGQSTVHLAAPAMDLLSTTRGTGYENFYGTSFAVPQVAGAAALLLTAHPGLTVDELRAAIFGSVDQPGGLKGKFMTSGRLNVGRALDYLTHPSPPAIVLHASPAGQPTAANGSIRVKFSRPMDPASVESALLLSPSVTGTFEWAADRRAFAFHPDTPLTSATNYTARIRGTAQDEAGGTLDGNYNGIRGGSPSDDFVWTFRFRLLNDDFAGAQRLSDTVGSLQGGNRFAWVELDEPPHVLGDYVHCANSVWFRWTAPQQEGWQSFDLRAGTTFDSLLAVYTGDRLDQLVPVAGNDNYGTRKSSRVSFATKAGTDYAVVVATKPDFDAAYGPGQDGGTFFLDWYPTPAPGFSGSQILPLRASSGAKLTLVGTNFTGATAVLFSGASATFTNAATTNLDLRITTIVPHDARSGPITVVTPHGSGTSSVTLEVLPPPLRATSLPNGDIEVSWNSTNPDFELEASDDLFGAAARWAPVGTAPTIDGARSTVRTRSGADATRFYRLRSRPGR